MKRRNWECAIKDSDLILEKWEQMYEHKQRLWAGLLGSLKKVVKSKIRKVIWSQIMEYLINKSIYFGLYYVDNGNSAEMVYIILFFKSIVHQGSFNNCMYNELKDIQIQDSPTFRKQFWPFRCKVFGCNDKLKMNETRK